MKLNMLGYWTLANHPQINSSYNAYTVPFSRKQSPDPIMKVRKCDKKPSSVEYNIKKHIIIMHIIAKFWVKY